MDTKKFALGTIAGGLTMFVLGYLIYGLALKGFFESNMVTNVMKDPPDFLWLAIGNLGFGAFITYIWVQWAGIKTFPAGAKAGATLGLLAGLAYGFTWFGTSDLMNLTATVADVVVTAVIWGVIGGVVGVVVGRE